MLGLSAGVTVQCGTLLYFIFYRSGHVYSKLGDPDGETEQLALELALELDLELELEGGKGELRCRGGSGGDVEMLLSSSTTPSAETSDSTGARLLTVKGSDNFVECTV